MKDKTTEELIQLFNELCAELKTRRYFEYLTNIGKWFRNVPNPECPERFPSAGISQPIEGMTEILAAIDAQKEYLKQYPYWAGCQNVIISAEELAATQELAGKLWDETVNNSKNKYHDNKRTES